MSETPDAYADAYRRLLAKATEGDGDCLRAGCGTIGVSRGRGATRTATTPARATWIAVYGPITNAAARVKRTCDTPDCINPEHLYLTDGSTGRTGPCAWNDCDEKREMGAYCALHYLDVKTLERAQREMRKPRCTEEECSQAAIAKGLCALHYGRHRRGTLRKPRPTTCIVEGCFVLPRAKGLCSHHYNRMRAGEDPATMTGGRRRCGEHGCTTRAWRQGLCGAHWVEQTEVLDAPQRDMRPYSKLR